MTSEEQNDFEVARALQDQFDRYQSCHLYINVLPHYSPLCREENSESMKESEKYARKLQETFDLEVSESMNKQPEQPISRTTTGFNLVGCASRILSPIFSPSSSSAITPSPVKAASPAKLIAVTPMSKELSFDLAMEETKATTTIYQATEAAAQKAGETSTAVNEGAVEMAPPVADSGRTLASNAGEAYSEVAQSTSLSAGHNAVPLPAGWGKLSNHLTLLLNSRLYMLSLIEIRGTHQQREPSLLH